MDRRTFVVTSAVLLVAPLTSEAQQAGKVYRIGILSTVSASLYYGSRIAAMRQGLRDLGYEEGKDLAIEYRWAEGKLDRLPGLAAELVALKVDVIVTHGTPGARAAKQATTTIPIVTATLADPVLGGLVASMARPGGNLTGLTNQDNEVALKRLQLLREVAPKISRIGFLEVPDTQPADVEESQWQRALVGARSLGVRLHRVNVRGVDDFPGAFSTLEKDGVNALSVANVAWLINHSAEIAAFALKHRWPTIGGSTRFTDGGLLMAYGPNLDDLWRRAAGYVDGS